MQALRTEAANGRPYVPGILAEGQFIFVSGQIPLRDGELVGPSIENQAEAVSENIEWILADAGATLQDVVRCGVFVADLDDLPSFNEVYQRAFGGRLPTRTTVGAILPGYGVEVDCIAVAPTARSTPA